MELAPISIAGKAADTISVVIISKLPVLCLFKHCSNARINKRFLNNIQPAKLMILSHLDKYKAFFAGIYKAINVSQMNRTKKT